MVVIKLFYTLNCTATYNPKYIITKPRNYKSGLN